ncbi:MAG: YicC family protein [Tidjanibacter sp.]|nr:YicC family protein [Tidjanibacter sp.]
MTGFGKAEVCTENIKITVETRSLNGKQLDLSVKMPSRYRPFEYDIRSRVNKVLQRGKVDMFISYELIGEQNSVNINEPLFNAYAQRFMALTAGSGLGFSSEVYGAIVTSIMRMPDVISQDQDAVGEEEQKALLEAVDKALAAHDAFRAQEGAVLIADLLGRVDKIQGYKQQVIPLEKARTVTIKQRIVDHLEQVGVQYDANRLEQEMIFYIEKLDITEEKVRLDKHCDYFREVAAEEENVGRKLGFVAQEMGREINTLGSKANDSEIQILVVKMKDELEKIKEQVLNIL